MPPQPLQRADVPIDWSLPVVANHPILTSGVGSCLIAFASTEALMGVLLAMIRWEHAEQAIDAWANTHNTRSKLALIKTEAELADAHCKVAIQALDSYTALAARRNRLAHGFFGIVLDRENEFAWREGSSAAKRTAAGLATSSLRPSPVPKTWVYKPTDFSELAQGCADTYKKIEIVLQLLPIMRGLTD